MTRHSTYIATFHTDMHTAVTDITASSAHQAMAEAHAILADPERWGELEFERYLDDLPVNHIVVESEHGETAEWHDDDLRLYLAAGDLLKALGDAVTALNTARRFKVPKLNTDSYAIAALGSRAIAKAKGQEQAGIEPP